MRAKTSLELLALAPLTIVLLTFVILPAILLFGYSLFEWVQARPTGSITLDNYLALLASPLALKVAQTTLAIALPVTLVCVVGGYVLAYYIVFGRGPGRQVLFVLVVTALMASYLARIYAWRILLGSNGVINGALTSAGLIDEPLQFLLFSPIAVVLAEASLFMPLAALTFVVALSGIEGNLREAARDLGAGPLQTLFRVTLPMSGQALLTTTTLTFYIAASDFLTPTFVGGPESVTAGRLIADSFGRTTNYGTGAATSMLLLLAFVLIYLIVRSAFKGAGLLPAYVR